MCITDARFQLGFVVEMLVLSLLSMSGAVLEYFSFLTKTSIIFKKKKKSYLWKRNCDLVLVLYYLHLFLILHVKDAFS